MLVGKQVADLITTSRALLAFVLPWMGVAKGESYLSTVAWLMVLNWMGDALDGTLARRSRRKYHTWIGDHDLEVDILVSIGLLLYIVGAGFVDVRVLGIYFLLWVLILWHWGFHRSLGMLIQAPIYGLFIWLALYQVPQVGIWLVIYLLAMMIITWPRFPQEIVPGFLQGMKEVLKTVRRD